MSERIPHGAKSGIEKYRSYSCSGIVSSHGLRIEACCRNQPNYNKSKVLLSLCTTMELKNKFKAALSINNIVCVAICGL